jgi:lipoprotein-releasing system permease protein
MQKIQTSINGITGISPWVGKEALISSKQGKDGVFVKGVDAGLDVSNTRKHIINGEFNLQRESESLHRLIIGKKLARKLGVKVGDKVIIQGITGVPSAFSLPRVMQFRVAGIYETGMSEYDDVYVYTSLASAQELFQYGSDVSGFNVLIANPDSAENVAKSITRLLGYPYYARTIFQNYRNLFTWIELQKKPIPIVLGLIIIVATFNIIGTLLMLVMEKTSDVGILKSMGASSSGVMRIFISEGLFIGIVGTLLGNLLAFGLCWTQQEYQFLALPEGIYYMNAVPILMQVGSFVMVSAISIMLCFLATLIPSWLASRLNPVNAIRFR